MKRVELLIDECREQTENSEYNSTTGIQQSEFIRFLNSSQQSLQNAICKQIQKIFLAEKNINILAYQANYSLPDDIFISNRVHAVWFSRTGQDKDLVLLDPLSMEERSFYPGLYPNGYIRNSGEIILTPPPTVSIVNGLRISYVKSLPTLDIRRAKISSVTTSNNSITALSIDLSSYYDKATLVNNYYASVVSKTGQQKMRKLPILDINTTTGVVTLDSFNFSDGESIAAGDYLVSGKNACNVSELPDYCEDYLINYTIWKILRRDSSVDSAEQGAELQKMEEDIITLFANIDENQKHINVTDYSFFTDN